MSAECRSAMFFGGAGECILSVASAQDAPDVFAEEEDEEHVVYFENGCVLENQIRTQKKQSTSKKGIEAKKVQPTVKLVNSTGLKSSNSSRMEDKKPQGSSGESKKAKPVEEKKPSSEDKEDKDKDDEAETAAGDDSQEATKPPRRVTQPLGRTRTNPKSSSSSGSGSPKSTKRLLQNATNGVEDAWGAWSEDCRSFDERRPCQNGNRVGFQSRQCLRTPFECQGPFFRYCIAPCQGALQ